MKRAPALPLLFLAGAAFSADGNTGAEFLKLPAGARPASLANTQAAIADGAESLFTNPAGLAGLNQGEISFSHNKLFEGVQDQRITLAWPTRGGTFALGYQRLSLEEFLGFDAQGNLTGALESGASAIHLGWGKNLVKDPDLSGGLFLGVAAKSLEEEHADVSASAFAADLGLMARPWGAMANRNPWLRRASLGLYARHLGQGLKFDNETTSLPTEYALGAGYSQAVGGDIWTAGLDLYQQTGEDSGIRLGLEYWLRGVFALRLGYQPSDVDNASFRAGAGFRLAKAQIDYAWSAQGDDLEAAHRFTISYKFGQTPVAPGMSSDLFKEYLARGKSHMDQGLYDRAIIDFNEALKINPRSEEAKSLLLECGRRLEGTPK